MRLISTIVLVSFALIGFSQQDPKAKEVLDKVSVKYKGFSTIKVEFSYIIENAQENTTDSHEGTLEKKDDKYHIKLMGSEIYFDGKDMWTFLPDAGEVNITTPDKDDQESVNPATVFSFYEKGFKYKYKAEVTEKEKKMHEIDLFPDDPKGKKFHRVTIYIGVTTNEIHSIHYFGKDGTDYLVNLSKMESNVPMADSMFSFDTKAHPKVEVVDLRD